MVSIENLHFSYRRKPVFTGLNLELKPGYIYGLLGRNGMGKSTLLRSIGGFLFPKRGRIGVMGFDPGKRQPAFFKRGVLLPEDFYLPPMRLERWVDLYSAFYPQFDRGQFYKAAEGFDLPTEGRLGEM